MKYTLKTIRAEDVLSEISQEDIFRHYLGIDIKKGLFVSPLRDDKNPTCRFFYRGNKLYFEDFSGHAKGDCFDIVSKIKGCSFAATFKMILDEVPKSKIFKREEDIPNESTHTKIDINTKPLSLLYWQQYGLDKEILERYNTVQVDVLWVNDKIQYNSSYASKEGFAFCFADNKYSVYFPNSKPKFVKNTMAINGLRQLKKADRLIITKSMKDVMCINKMGIQSIAPQSETLFIEERILDRLKNEYKDISILYDNDETGRYFSDLYSKKYDIRQIFTETKDISDYILETSFEEASYFLKNN